MLVTYIGSRIKKHPFINMARYLFAVTLVKGLYDSIECIQVNVRNINVMILIKYTMRNFDEIISLMLGIIELIILSVIVKSMKYTTSAKALMITTVYIVVDE